MTGESRIRQRSCDRLFKLLVEWEENKIRLRFSGIEIPRFPDITVRSTFIIILREKKIMFAIW